ncbi:hypothetical protein FRZ67_06565 [Panacibacter ginsenosidivorans]|uniref:2TM domain-containing protein n=1 Tax=Panacibacter ginsenosidivorans TaxID=1813871 RepID=A0A5B8V754_9BACT|nr:hypothetical protein [Panacibacter ginsenosidivorans]QEC66975.1 hypothetical protein FRZ67_06565 [Panacibacter ginsenosidivorans]
MQLPLTIKDKAMSSSKENIPINKLIILAFVLINAIIAEVAFIHNANWYWALLLTIPLLVVAIYNARRNQIF